MKGNKLAKANTAARTRKSAASKKKTKTTAAKSPGKTKDEEKKTASAPARKKTTSATKTVKKKKTAAGAARKKSATKSTKTVAARKSAGGATKKRKHAAAKVANREATVTTASPSASVERDDETIIIRFPSAAPPLRKSRKPIESDQASPDEDANAAPKPERATAADSPNDSALKTPDAPEVAAADKEAEPTRGKRRRGRRRRKSTRPESEDKREDTQSARPEDHPEAEAEAAETNDADEAPAQGKRPRRRRRRSKSERPESEHTEAKQLDEQAESESTEAEPSDTEAEPSETEDADERADEEEPARGRRRRSRRRGRGGRAADSEQQSEADAGAPKLSDEKEMIINVVPREECRIAIMEAGKLQEIYLERASSENHVGNIYKGLVTNVEPSIQAAFVDFGQGKNGFLHISDLHPEYFPDGEGQTENVGRKTPRRSRPPIQRCLRRKQELLVQITKEGIGTKGPTLTTYLSIPGRFLVMMPSMRQLGVSRKIEDEDARHKLRDQLNDLDLPENMGFIARTAALEHTKRELQSDLNYLSRLWKSVETRIKKNAAPTELYTESDLVIRTIRDVYTSDIKRILVDNADVADRANEFLSIFSPRSHNAVVFYDKPEPIFHRYRIEQELESLHSRHVPLKSGGSIVIDQTEALVAVDVNSGKFRSEDDAETTAYKINLEAADEIPRQLRLRDLGGLVICDFIDMRQEKHKREVERKLSRNLKEHKERAKILRTSDFGIIEMTRQRQRASLTRSVYQDCQNCNGTGLVKTPESVALDVMRLIQLAVAKESVRSIEVTVSPEVAHLLQNRKRTQLHSLETDNQRLISIRGDGGGAIDAIKMQCHDQRGRIVSHS